MGKPPWDNLANNLDSELAISITVSFVKLKKDYTEYKENVQGPSALTDELRTRISRVATAAAWYVEGGTE